MKKMVNDLINNPNHYQQENGRECIEEMVLLFGKQSVIDFCRCNAYKYKFRAGKKEGNPKEQDLAKANWYLDYIDRLKESEEVV